VLSCVVGDHEAQRRPPAQRAWHLPSAITKRDAGRRRNAGGTFHRA